MSVTQAGKWRRCASCKRDLGFGETYFVCSVTTCNRERTGLVFCSEGCFEAHVPVMRHRDAWAIEKKAPVSAAAAAAAKARGR